MKRTFLLAASVLFVIPVLLSAQTRGTLIGSVVDEDGEAIISGGVEILGTSRGAATELDGSFSIPGVVAGDYQVRATAVGYAAVIQAVTIKPNTTTTLDFVLPDSTDEVTVVVRAARTSLVDAETSGKETTFSRDDILAGNTNSALAEVGRTTSADGALRIRAGRSSETSIRRDGFELGDPVSGGLGPGTFPDVSALAIQQVSVLASGFEAEYGNVLSGAVNTQTRSGRNDRFEATFAYRTNLPFLYGSSQDITVQKVGTDTDTLLPGYQLGTSGTSTYEFGIGGYVPGIRMNGQNALTFFLTGIYTPSFKTGGYKVADMSQEYADARRDIADRVWGYHLDPTVLSERENEDHVRNVNLKLSFQPASGTQIELGGEIGRSSTESSAWSQYYLLDRPVFFRNENGTIVTDTVTSYLERDAQGTDANTFLDRVTARFFKTLGNTSFFEIQAGYVSRFFEAGEKDESLSYGILDVFDIPEIVDEVTLEQWDPQNPDDILQGGNAAIDRYELPRNPDGEFVRNPITGLIEGPQAPGASRNPYGIIDLNFPAYGNPRTLELRDSKTISLKGTYGTNFELDLSGADTSIRTNLRAGFDVASFTIRRHNNSLPWDTDPFNDVYGYTSPYINDPDLSSLLSFLEEPAKPFQGAVWAQTRFSYNTIVFSPGLRFDFFNPNTVKAPLSRQTVNALIDGLANNEDATMKFQVSPRIGISYPITTESNFRVNFAMMFKMPDFNILFDNAYGDAQRGNQLFGNPDIEPQKVIVYDLGYEARIADGLFIDVSAFYRDVFNQSGVTFVPAVPSSYVLYTVQEYGNVRGLEIALQRTRRDNFFGRINYTLQRAVGTASSPSANYGTLIGQADPYTGEARDNPLTEFPLSYDRTHAFNATVGVYWNNNEGPTLGGIHLLENTTADFTVLYGSGLPYTLVNERGEQQGEFNANRFPGGLNTEFKLTRSVLLGELLGSFAGNSRLELYALVRNVFNTTGPVSFYTTSGSPDQNNTSLNRGIGEFPATDYYAEADDARPETISQSQFDTYGRRYYNPYADANLDGVSTQAERYDSYRRFVATIQSFRSNYDTPRTVVFGARLYF